MIEPAKHPRAKAFIALGYETSLRIMNWLELGYCKHVIPEYSSSTSGSWNSPHQ